MIRVGLAINGCDREAIGYVTQIGGIDSGLIIYLMLEYLEKRFAVLHISHPVE
ncbi:hypothetical protein [Desulfocurvibacter africanus]|uniref:hypothetical protein n=1 Tax=Desulfocurvibacter africanus TaxID=873 RepID=UPI0004273B33|nr:hypothetical protein [Desulfocurvibacter africanus]